MVKMPIFKAIFQKMMLSRKVWKLNLSNAIKFQHMVAIIELKALSTGNRGKAARKLGHQNGVKLIILMSVIHLLIPMRTKAPMTIMNT